MRAQGGPFQEAAVAEVEADMFVTLCAFVVFLDIG